MKATTLVSTLQVQLLRLYPAGFRATFAEEMALVFAERLADAAQGGRRQVFAISARELLDLPGRLLAEHWEALRGGVSSATSRTPSPRQAAGWGAVGFALALALSWLAGLASPGVTPTLILLAGGGLGGILLSFGALRGRAPGRFTLGGALALLLGQWAMRQADTQLTGRLTQDNPTWLLVFMLQPLILGAVTGGLAGSLRFSRRGALQLALAGAAAFVLGRAAGVVAGFVYWGLAQAIDSYRPGFDGQLSRWVVLGAALMLWLVPSLASGLVGGAVLGWKSARPCT